jgi:hypothetical protein
MVMLKTKPNVITSLDQIPDSFSSWEEDEFWRTHEFAAEVFETGAMVDAELYAALGIPDPKFSAKDDRVRPIRKNGKDPNR